jgi:hypothetical protein
MRGEDPYGGGPYGGRTDPYEVTFRHLGVVLQAGLGKTRTRLLCEEQLGAGSFAVGTLAQALEGLRVASGAVIDQRVAVVALTRRRSTRSRTPSRQVYLRENQSLDGPASSMRQQGHGDYQGERANIVVNGRLR